MTCGCNDCRTEALAFDALESGRVPADPAVLSRVVSIWEGRAENAEAEARIALDFARADDGFAVTLADDGLEARAAMFRGMAFRLREHAAEHRREADRWRGLVDPMTARENAA